MTHVVAGLIFLGFVGLVTALALPLPVLHRHKHQLRGLLVLYVVASSGLSVLSQRDLWPFSSWRLMVVAAPSEIGGSYERVRVVGLAADGREYPVDHRAVEPIDLGELRAWLRRHLSRASEPTVDQLCGFLHEGAERARQEVRDGRTPGVTSRLLGPFSAPKHTLYPSLWTTPEDVPADPFEAVVVYSEHWTLEGRAADPAAIDLEPLLTCRRP